MSSVRSLILGSAVLATIAIAFSALTARADGPAISGRFFTNTYLPFFNTPTPDIQQVDNEAWLTVSDKPNRHVIARATLVGQSYRRPINQLGSQSSQLIVREAYIRYRDSGWDFQAGRILIPWGNSDYVNPTDYFSAKNYQITNWDPEVQRIGPTAFILSDTPQSGDSPFTFTAVLAPIFAQDQIAFPPSLIPAGFTVNDPATPNFTPGAMEAALKVSYAGDDWNGSLSAYHGWNHFPDFSPIALSGSGVMTTPQFHRVSAVGGDLSVSLDSLVFRAESAFHWTENPDGTNPYVSPPMFDAVAGFEWPMGDRFRAEVQGLFHYVEHFHPLSSLDVADAYDQDVAAANSVLQEYDFQTLPGATGRLTYTSEDEDWKAELFVLSYFPPASVPSFDGETAGPAVFFQPRLTHELTTNLKATIGLDQYFAPANRLLGYSRDYNAAFFEVLYVL